MYTVLSHQQEEINITSDQPFDISVAIIDVEYVHNDQMACCLKKAVEITRVALPFILFPKVIPWQSLTKTNWPQPTDLEFRRMNIRLRRMNIRH